MAVELTTPRPADAAAPAPAAHTPTVRGRSFDFLRLAAATAVLVSHSFIIVGREEPSLGGLALGSMAVLVFFAISGFLITQSWVLNPNWAAFVAKRALRIMPALLAVLVIAAIALGPAVSSLGPADYFSQSQPYTYVATNASLLKTTYELPGVFADNTYPDAVNGSLWTLRYEVRAYALVLLAGLLGCFALVGRRPALAVLPVLGVIVLEAVEPLGHLLDPDLIGAFVVGSLLYLMRDRVPLRWWMAVVLLAVWLAAPPAVEDLCGALAIAYTTLVIAFAVPDPLRPVTRRGDFSYGVYLWAFPVQQVIAHLWPSVKLGELVPVAAIATLGLAAASWYLVERPALRLKGAVVGRLPDRRTAMAGGVTR
jgi:peptidoglycan/LPS O-acetylase OafA/YrhL